MEGLYSSKSSFDSPLSLLSDSRSLALIDRLKAPRNSSTVVNQVESNQILVNIKCLCKRKRAFVLYLLS